MANIEPIIQAIKDAGGMAAKSQSILEQSRKSGLSEEAIKALAQHARDQHRTQWMEKVQTGLSKDANPVYQSFNLAPNAQFKVVKFRNGSVKKIPWDDPVPSDATVLNKTVEDLDTMGFKGKDPVTAQNAVDPNVQAAINAIADKKAINQTLATTAAVPAAGGAIVAGASGVNPFTSQPWTPPTTQEDRLTENDNYPAYNGQSIVEAALKALGSQRPSEGLTENENYSAGEGMSPVYQGKSFETDPNTGGIINSADLSNAATGFGNVPQRQVGAGQPNSIGMDLRGSSNFNPSAMRFSTDRPVVKAAQQVAQKAAAPAAAQQSGGIGSFLSNLFSNKGGEYQSTGERLYRGDMPEKGMNVQKPTGVNWGDPDRASDFFRASKALQGLQKPQDQNQASAEKRGGRVSKTNEHSAILHKALEIIHHMALKNH